eukprot:maker-scaffold362_size196086-snap-gene-0.25 protein:Tk09349 transcript:maker-scaffold362_size196086-snap-gene-0.25-mRNA-1 annotation:"hypothetical protein DAPPUDRAFT_256239"
MCLDPVVRLRQVNSFLAAPFGVVYSPPRGQDQCSSPSRKGARTCRTSPRVRLQNVLTKKWDAMGTITSIRDQGRSYEIQPDEAGTQILRNRRFLRPTHDSTSKTISNVNPTKTDTGIKLPSSILRRSPCI